MYTNIKQHDLGENVNRLDFTLLLARSGASLQQMRTARNRLVGLRRIRIRRHTRQQVMNLIKVLTASSRPQNLLPGMVVRARVKRFNPDHSVIVEVGKGGTMAVIPKDRLTTSSLRAGQLKREDTLWLSVDDVVYHEKGVQHQMSMRTENIPLEILKRQNTGLYNKVDLVVLKRIPGVKSVIEVRPLDLVKGVDYHALVAGPNHCHLRAVSEMLRGESVVLRINRRVDSSEGGLARA